MEQSQDSTGQDEQGRMAAEGAMEDIMNEMEKYFSAEQNDVRTLALIAQTIGRYQAITHRRHA